MSIAHLLYPFLKGIAKTEKSLAMKADLISAIKSETFKGIKARLSSSLQLCSNGVMLSALAGTLQNTNLFLSNPTRQSQWISMMLTALYESGCIEAYTNDKGWWYVSSTDTTKFLDKTIVLPRTAPKRGERTKVTGFAGSRSLHKGADHAQETIDIIQSVALKYENAIITKYDDMTESYVKELNRLLKLQGDNLFYPEIVLDSRCRQYQVSAVADFIGNKELRSSLRFADGSKIVWLDTISSGMIIMSAITRDVESLAMLLGWEPEWLEKAIEWFEAKHKMTMAQAFQSNKRGLYTFIGVLMDTECPRKVLKEDATVPHFYGSGVSALCLCEYLPNLTPEQVTARYSKAYDKLVPGGAALREAFIASHNPNVESFSTKAFDACDCAWAYHKTTEHKYQVGFKADGTTVSCNISITYQSAVAGKCRGVKALGANHIHMTDAGVLREMNRMCNYPSVEWLQNKVEILKRCNSDLSMGVEPRGILTSIIEAWNNTKMRCCRGLWYINKPMDLPEDYRQMLLECCEAMPKRPFPIVNIHDCFGVHQEDVDETQRVMSFIVGSLYKSEILEYWNRTVLKDHPVPYIGKYSKKSYNNILKQRFLEEE